MSFAFFLTSSRSAVSQFPRWEPARFLWALPPSCPHTTQAHTLPAPFGGRGADYWVSTAWLGDLAACICPEVTFTEHDGAGAGGVSHATSLSLFPHQESKDNLTYSSELLYRVNGTMHVKSGARNLAGAR